MSVIQETIGCDGELEAAGVGNGGRRADKEMTTEVASIDDVLMTLRQKHGFNLRYPGDHGVKCSRSNNIEKSLKMTSFGISIWS